MPRTTVMVVPRGKPFFETLQESTMKKVMMGILMGVVLLCTSVSAATKTTTIRVYENAISIKAPQGDLGRVAVAMSDTLGFADTKAIGEWDVRNKVWIISGTANKDEHVYFAFKNADDTLTYINVAAKTTRVVRGSNKVTHVTKNTDGSISYRYRKIAKQAPKVWFDNGVLYGNLGTNVISVEGTGLVPTLATTVEFQSDRCGWLDATHCGGLLHTDTKTGNTMFAIDTHSNDVGALALYDPDLKKRYWFDISRITNGSGVTKVDIDAQTHRLQLGTPLRGTISYAVANSVGILKITSGYDGIPTLPDNVSEVKGCLLSNQLGWDFKGTITPDNANDTGLCVPFVNEQGNYAFRFESLLLNADPNTKHLLSGDNVQFVILGKDGAEWKEYWLPLADFAQEGGVAVKDNVITYGSSLPPSQGCIAVATATVGTATATSTALSHEGDRSTTATVTGNNSQQSCTQ